VRYWLMKSEPDVFSIEHLRQSPDATAGWDGVRNYLARNHMREMKVNDGVLFYHSRATPPGVVGIARVATEAHTDATQFDPASDYYDPKSTPENPRWSQVCLRFERAFEVMLPLDDLRNDPKLEGMTLIQKGSRLSVQTVSAAHWKHILKLAGVQPERVIREKKDQTHPVKKDQVHRG
jgi:predicted RNA-binding protein with PUA-like domain